VSEAPLDDPEYDPQIKPVRGDVPDVVAKWGPRSQRRWFRRFYRELRPQKPAYWDRFYCESEDHIGPCCISCGEDGDMGDLDGKCCCHAIKTGL
jgi:hypothetical protein